MWGLLLGVACAGGDSLPRIEIAVAGHELKVEVADEPAERTRGLMYRRELGEDAGMLFIFPSQGPRSFWMKNTPLPLSIAYVDADGRIVSISDMVPHDVSSVPSAAPALYAIETNKGWFAAHGIAAGASVTGLPPASSQ